MKLGRFGVALAILVAGVVTTDAQQPQASPPPPPAQQAQPAGKPANIDRNGVLMLVRSVILALDQANKTGNYTVLRDLGAPGFQANTAAKLAEIFASQRNDKLDLSGVAVIDPQLTVLPEIQPNGLMRMAGFFPVGAVAGQFRAAVRPGRRPVAAVRHFSEGRLVRAGGAGPGASSGCRNGGEASATEGSQNRESQVGAGARAERERLTKCGIKPARYAGTIRAIRPYRG